MLTGERHYTRWFRGVKLARETVLLSYLLQAKTSLDIRHVTPKRRPTQKKMANKTWLLWNIPGHIRENPPCLHQTLNWDVNKTWNLMFCLRLSWRVFLVGSDKEGFLGFGQVCCKAARVFWILIFFCTGQHFGVTFLMSEEDFVCLQERLFYYISHLLYDSRIFLKAKIYETVKQTEV